MSIGVKELSGGGMNLAKRKGPEEMGGDVPAKNVERRYHYVEEPILNVSKF